MTENKLDIKDLSEFIILYFIKNDISISHLKLQKILYYIQAWHLVYFDKNPLFDEIPEAWVNGPVYRTIYDQLKQSGVYSNISLKSAYSQNIDTEYQKIRSKLTLSEKQWEFLDAIFKHYGSMSHDKLVFLTHSEIPWNKAREGINMFEYSDQKISFESMYEFYKARLESKKIQS